MVSAPKLADLERMSDYELREAIDAHTRNTVVGLNFYMEELRRRESRRLMRTVSRLTWAMAGMTLLILALTAVNMWLVWRL